jgi:energy-coupling factor transport system ATP-binding protein
MNKAIELEDVSYRYPKARTSNLKNITISIEKGKFVVIMGPTGAGKTTLSLCLNGLIPQLLEGDLTGNITVAGRDLSKYRVQTMSKHIGLVLQDPEAQIFGMTVREDTAFGPRNLSLSVEEIYERVDRALEKVRLKGYEDRNTSELSGGEKQRLAIAGVLAMQPEVLVLDEPSSELDPEGRAEIYKTIDELRLEKDLTILAVEHYSEEVIARANEVVVLNQGEIAWRGEPEKLFRNIPLLYRLGIKPLPVSLVGWDLYQKGWITSDEIPLDVQTAEKMIRNLLIKHGNRQLENCSKRSGIKLQEKKLQPLLQVTNLKYRYNRGQTALKSINLTVQKGEFIALIGPNGAGKTTLAKHLNGLLKPTEGDVIIDGINTKESDISQLSRVVGYVFQNPDHQIFSVSVEKELEYGLKNAGFEGAEIKQRIDEALKITGLEKYRNVHPFSLGKGERQVIAVTSILALKPKILVVDEPTTGLDWAGINKMMSLIKKLHENGTTIIMISHDMDIVAKHARRVIVMKDGGILLDGKTKEVFSNFEALQQASILPPQIVRLTKGLEDLGFQETLLDESEFTAALLRKLEDVQCL